MLNRNLDMEALRALVVVADLASFSNAALQLGRTQSAVSLQIKRLEEMLGQILLRRIQGRVDGATSEGQALIAYARQILRLNDEAYSCVAQDTAVGTLRIGLPEELMEYVFPAAMPRFQALYPRMQLRLQSDTSANLQMALARAELDLILFKHCAAETPASDSNIWQETLVWIAGESYADQLPKPLPLALFGENCAFRMAATGALAKAGIANQLVYSGSSLTGLRHAVRCGLGITALPRSLLQPGLLIIETGLPALPLASIAARHTPGETHPAALRFVTLMGEEIRLQRS
jgi:DNA-binding transcriptional LysR family regulator